MAKLGDIIKISDADYVALKDAGASGYVINGTRYYYDANNIYLTPNNTGNVIALTYAQLATLRTNSQLIPGTYYRITDYSCTSTQPNSASAGHIFDIIVLAVTSNKLSEEALATNHDGDTYFSACNLHAWKLWYCLDNDANRFAWTDSVNGKGVIYRMIDEFGNDCPYDFKNILFTSVSTGAYSNAYTFSFNCRTIPPNPTDASIQSGKNCHGNIIKPLISLKDGTTYYWQILNNIVFACPSADFNCCDNVVDVNCSNIYSSAAGTSKNIIGKECYNLKINAYNNKYGNNCHDIYMSLNSGDNFFDDFAHDINIGSNCIGNHFGKYCNSIKFVITNSSSQPSSTIADYCSFNTFDINCSHMIIYSSQGSPSSSYPIQNIHFNSAANYSSNTNIDVIRNAPGPVHYPISVLLYESTSAPTVTYYILNKNIKFFKYINIITNVTNNGQSENETFLIPRDFWDTTSDSNYIFLNCCNAIDNKGLYVYKYSNTAIGIKTVIGVIGGLKVYGVY